MPKLYELIQREAPQVRLNMCTTVSEAETAIQLRDHSMDAVLHFERFDNQDLQYKVVIRHQPVIIARRDHPRIDGDTASKQKIMQEKLVRVAGTHGSSAVMAEDNEVFKFIARKTAMIVPSAMAQMAVVARSDLLAITSLQIARPFLQSFALKVLPNPWNIEPIHAFMVWHRTAEGDAGGAWFRSKLHEAVRSLLQESECGGQRNRRAFNPVALIAMAAFSNP
ncbi:LysR substrate-binding domain-containing protein [Candidatus Methylospira mobilis]|uniref:LysR substrate-binding domain-containing protein n=1 Tax=Candidatus Methylospira mobilis TaxID=1808979 RepID=UPI001D17C7DB|nr:LysR substrate-binding domain-containing protein [Candidatus Methylospira mobilis]